jgi:hypothetical protein
MRHSITHAASAEQMPVWGWILITAIGVALIATVIIVSVRRKRRGETASRLTERQEFVLQEFETQVRALLAQRGGRMSQIEIQRALGLPADLVAGKLLEMEHDGMVDRDWMADEYTFGVQSSR